MEKAVASKRRRDCGEIDEETLESPSPSPPEAKRIRADLFFDILDDESEPDNTDIDSVMRSLEEELGQQVAVSDTDPVEAEASCSDPEPKQPDLGFLLEASDDELGLPPPEPAATYGVVAGVVQTDAGREAQEAGFGKIWGLDDEIHLDFGFGSGDLGVLDNGGDDGVGFFDGGLFDHDGEYHEPADFSDLTWRPDFLPAV